MKHYLGEFERRAVFYNNRRRGQREKVLDFFLNALGLLSISASFALSVAYGLAKEEGVELSKLLYLAISCLAIALIAVKIGSKKWIMKIREWSQNPWKIHYLWQ